MKKRRVSASGGGSQGNEMMTTFADMMTLLMTFFVLLLAMANFDPVRFGNVKVGIEEAFARIVTTSIQEELMGEEEQLPGAEGRKDTELALDSVQEMIDNRGVGEYVRVKAVPGGFEVELVNSALFASGSATLQRTIKPVLAQLAETISGIDGSRLEVQGHTDDEPIHTEQFPSNWELSSMRAINVLRFMTAHGADPGQVKAVAYADTIPLKPNRDQMGRPIQENQAANRRVVLLVTSAVGYDVEDDETPAWKKRIRIQEGQRVDLESEESGESDG